MKAESTRQKKFSKRIQEELSFILMKDFPPPSGTLLSIHGVRTTPDLLLCRIYFSVFPATQSPVLMEEMEARKKEIRNSLAQKIGKLVRRMPELEFRLDDTLEEVDKMEDLFRKIRKEEP